MDKTEATKNTTSKPPAKVAAIDGVPSGDEQVEAKIRKAKAKTERK